MIRLHRARMISLSILLFVAAPASAQVFINKVFVNPPGSTDAAREFIELMGTPGMKLDGYLIAIADGKLSPYWALNFFQTDCTPDLLGCAGYNLIPEFDEAFSLDGLSLGKNGLLVLGNNTIGGYPTLLSDTNFVNWDTLWNGGADTPGNLENDGSLTIMLVRNRPGSTQANPTVDLRWGKDGVIDMELARPVIDPQDGMPYDRMGNGSLDKGGLAGLYNVDTVDLRGATTSEVEDDLEIVDEVSYESDRGQEYDVDERRVDIGSPSSALPERRVHALDDPAGFNPDCLVRVDYRTKGPGWPTVTGATGETGPSMNRNWQDTATEQWIRGDTLGSPLPSGSNPPYFFSHVANTNSDALQPYNVHVPKWLSDGSSPDFSFTQASYEIAAGRVNPLAVTFIPGDVDRDGDCDADDIAKLAAVFGNDNWTFSNSFAGSTYGHSADPATQTRPWDVDGTGDNGIEPSDLQWVLNFQANTDGRVSGVLYDSTTASAAGVALNSNAGTTVTISASASNPCGHALGALRIGDIVEYVVAARVTAGANSNAGQQNGIMQFVQDVAISTGGILQAQSVTPLGSYSTTRAAIQSTLGTGGDAGMSRINGHSTSFTQGLGAQPVALYRVTLLAVGAGSATVSVAPSATATFASSTPQGVKLGHTNNNGNPAASDYSATSVAVTVTSQPNGDIDGDNTLDGTDVAMFIDVMLKIDTNPLHVSRSDLNCDNLADGQDIAPFVGLLL